MGSGVGNGAGGGWGCGTWDGSGAGDGGVGMGGIHSGEGDGEGNSVGMWVGFMGPFFRQPGKRSVLWRTAETPRRGDAKNLSPIGGPNPVDKTLNKSGNPRQPWLGGACLKFRHRA